MVYGMEHSWTALILVILAICSAGCLETLFGEPPHKAETPAPTTVPIVQSTSPLISLSDMALQPSDLPSDYILQDRSVMASPEVSQLGRDLGWRQGYFVSFYRMDSYNNVLTRVRQSVSIFTSDTMNGIFLVEKEDLKNQQISPGTRYEIPFPAVGERSIAFRDMNSTDADWPVTYTVIFTKKNVYEKIIMSGTSTDYETLKHLVLRAEALVQ
jgi:hypothetical protein